MSQELAKYYVQIIPSAKGIGGDIVDEIDGEDIGKKSGKSIVGGIMTVFAVSKLADGLMKALDIGGALQQSMGGGGENPFGAYEEGGEDEEWNPFDDYEDKEDEESGENGTEAGENEEDKEDTDEVEEKAEQSVFVKAFESFLAKEEESINKE